MHRERERAECLLWGLTRGKKLHGKVPRGTNVCEEQKNYCRFAFH